MELFLDRIKKKSKEIQGPQRLIILYSVDLWCYTEHLCADTAAEEILSREIKSLEFNKTMTPAEHSIFSRLGRDSKVDFSDISWLKKNLVT